MDLEEKTFRNAESGMIEQFLYGGKKVKENSQVRLLFFFPRVLTSAIYKENMPPPQSLPNRKYLSRGDQKENITQFSSLLWVRKTTINWFGNFCPGKKLDNNRNRDIKTIKPRGKRLVKWAMVVATVRFNKIDLSVE